MWAFSSCGERGRLQLQRKGFSLWWLLLLQSVVSRAHHLSHPKACGIFPDQGLNLCPLHWQAGFNHWVTREVPFGGILESSTSYRQ